MKISTLIFSMHIMVLLCSTSTETLANPLDTKASFSELKIEWKKFFDYVQSMDNAEEIVERAEILSEWMVQYNRKNYEELMNSGSNGFAYDHIPMLDYIIMANENCELAVANLSLHYGHSDDLPADGLGADSLEIIKKICRLNEKSFLVNE